MNKSKIITFPPSDEKRRVLLVNNELIKITPPPPPLPEFTIIEETENEITFIYDGSPVTYGIVDGENDAKWLDRNLGAGGIAQAIGDED